MTAHDAPATPPGVPATQPEAAVIPPGTATRPGIGVTPPGTATARQSAPAPQVVPATHADAGALSQVIAAAFHDLAPSRWLIGDPVLRREVFPGFFRLFVEHALSLGTVHTTPGRTAVALWIPVGPEGATAPDDYPARRAALTSPWTGRFIAFDGELERHHPTGTAHHHLAFLAVHPDAQSQGTGSALLRAHHTLLDDAGIPAYLEAAGPRSRDLYLRHGYALCPRAPFHLPEGGPPMWPMWRPPRTRPLVPAPRS